MGYAARIRRSMRGCRFKLSLRLCLFEEEFTLDFFGFLIALPFLDRWHREPYEIMESWGLSWYGEDSSLMVCWGDYTKFIGFPWQYRHFSTLTLRPDGTWVPSVGCWETDKEPDGHWERTLPYHYMLRNGEVQHRRATISVERREWRQRWLFWCPWFAKVRKSIDVDFDDEVGERTGSWKGGVLGCGYDLKPNETPEECLRRMQDERRFN